MKKLLFFFAMLMPLMASAEEWVEINGIMYIINSTSEDWSACVTAKEDDYGINSYKGKVTIPSSVAWNGYTYPVSRIIAQAFDGCVGLTSVTIPSSVTSIGDYAFSGCKNLTSVYCYATSVPELVDYGNNQFNEVSNYIPLYVPEKSVEAYKNSFAWSRNFRIIIPLGSEPPADVAINETNFPDANFRNFLLSQDYGTDGALSFEDLDQIYSLNVSNKGIQNMKGIEHFFALSYLYIYQNSIKGDGMDALVEGLPVIEEGDDTHHEIYAMYNTGEGNVMTAAQVAAAKAKGWTTRAFDGYYWMEYAGGEPEPETEDIAINETNFPDANFRNYLLGQSFGSDGVITVDEIANIKYFELRDMNIQSLEGIKYFTELTSLDCAMNNLDSLNVSVYPKLQYLVCFSNKITKLIVSGCSKLYMLNCNTNQLTLLDVSGCTALTTIGCFSNMLSGAAMDAFIATLPTVNNRPLNVIYYENEQNVMTTEQIAAAKAKGWIPQYYDYDAGAWKDYEGGTPIPTPTPTQQCAKPTINYEDGKVTFSCATEGVTFHYYCYATYRADGVGDEIEFPQQQFIRIDVYASKEGYEDSETEIAVLPVGGTAGIKGDVNDDGTVNGTDIQEVINIIVNAE